MTPSSICLNTGKRTFPSYTEAKEDPARRPAETIFECPACGGWHHASVRETRREEPSE